MPCKICLAWCSRFVVTSLPQAVKHAPVRTELAPYASLKLPGVLCTTKPHSPITWHCNATHKLFKALLKLIQKLYWLPAYTPLTLVRKDS